ncbi:baseplate J/gp47 family protein [Avibacterium paragallinarum]|uniref:Phage protein n=2 Tax=Avibacterium paragallinarum TaxID=728 RepID=A0A0F5ESY2_AVIPA|nr:baseplate J/gp47 family protein [Avibacterium paragallinarum]MEE3608265.1 baseplate J/gp47 family protein [Avibacterium paragallinarum]MEE3621611.1 baseplate J/gp47 family protein [Avibacterium paragallinarum]MEE3669432.1 baseplate J/gp47 family protein [Avibacterium paragallinarum]MEE3680424.1 baseplate J/gp47 family protein [Avibacterium paragallinarum]MEE4385917.1 baseplate J/gp47 family protein [Avibacterium paragallinarum]
MSNEFKQILVDSGLPTEESEIRQEFERLTQQEGLITNTSRMSPFWRLISAVAIQPVKWLTHHLISEILPNLFVKTAKGKWLQIQAWAVGLDFKEATKAEGEITFYKQSDLTPIIIPQGTIVQTERINGVIFRVITTAATEIPKGSISGKVPVIAEAAGSDYNLASGYYRILPEPINGIESVLNEAEWLLTPGSDKETDEELRQRYRTQFSSVGQHHIDSVYRGMIAKIAGLSVDRIYFKHDAPRGPGTANAYLLLDTGVTSQPFVDRVNHYVRDEGYHGHGDDLLCFAMPETQHRLTCKLYFAPSQNVSELKQTEIKTQVENMIRCAFRENNNYAVTKTYPHSRFSWSRLGEEIHEAQPLISSIIWGQQDILSDLAIPRIQSLTVSIEQ